MSNSKAELANAMHDRKYNCCQSVACAAADEAGMDMATLFKVCEGFGNGMGCTQSVCGALAGAVVLAGCVTSDGNLDDPQTKRQTTALSKEMLNRFKEKTGAILCKELKGVETGVVLCSCPDCITAGVEVVQEVLGL